MKFQVRRRNYDDTDGGLEDVNDLLLAEPGLAHDEFSSVGYITGELSLFLHLFSGRRSPAFEGLFRVREFSHMKVG
jgi:hypothetical protein